MTEYQLNATDIEIVRRASRLLQDTISARLVTPAQLISLGKVLHALERLPAPTNVGEVAVRLIGPRQHHGDIETYFWWEVEVEEELVTVKSGGHFYRPSTGGDTFSSMIWQVAPDYPPELRDYHEQQQIVPGLRSFATALPTAEELLSGYSLTIEDPVNEWLTEDEFEPTGDDEESDYDEEGPKDDVSCLIGPRDEHEQRLAAMVDDVAVEVTEPQYAYGVTDCGVCGRDLSECGLMVGGRLRGSLMWGNLCCRCFSQNGEGLGTGLGQLYAQQPDGQWRLVAGFAS